MFVVLLGCYRQYERFSDAVFQSVSTAWCRRSQFSSYHVTDVIGRGQAVAADQCSASQRRRGGRDRCAEPRDGTHPAAVPRDRQCSPRRRRRRSAAVRRERRRRHNVHASRRLSTAAAAAVEK